MDPLNRLLLQDLVSATKSGSEEQLVKLLSMGVQPNVVDSSSGWSALHAAVLFNLGSLPMLLRHCTEPDVPTVGGGTPLAYVVHELGENPAPGRSQELVAAIEMLLSAGARPGAGVGDQTPLELARLYRLSDVQVLLERRGSNESGA